MKTTLGITDMLLYDNKVNLRTESLYIQAGGTLTKNEGVLQLGNIDLYRECYLVAIKQTYKEKQCSSI